MGGSDSPATTSRRSAPCRWRELVVVHVDDEAPIPIIATVESLDPALAAVGWPQSDEPSAVVNVRAWQGNL